LCEASVVATTVGANLIRPQIDEFADSPFDLVPDLADLLECPADSARRSVGA
jgi:hypothetical protein